MLLEPLTPCFHDVLQRCRDGYERSGTRNGIGSVVSGESGVVRGDGDESGVVRGESDESGNSDESGEESDESGDSDKSGEESDESGDSDESGEESERSESLIDQANASNSASY